MAPSVLGPGPTPASRHMPLDGVRVLEVSRLMPGALVGWWLAALGAEVVKVEEPGRGDYMRSIPPHLGDRSVLHLLLDRGKRSVSADLTTAADRDLVLALMGAADVVIDGMRPGSLSKHGIDYAALRAQHADLVVCSITGFGQNGPLRDLPAHGMTIDTMAGVAAVHDDPPADPVLPWALSNSIGVECGASSAVIAVLGAVLDVRAGRGGGWLDVSMWDAAVHANRLAVACALSGEVDPPRITEFGPLQATYRCGDGRHVMLALIEHKFWARFCEAVARPDLLGMWNGQGEVGFGTEALRAELAALFRERGAGEWEALFRSIDVPANLVHDVTDVVRSSHFAARAPTGDPAVTDGAPVVGAPVRRMEDGTRPGLALGPSPGLGADTADVTRRWLGADATSSTARRQGSDGIDTPTSGRSY